MGRKPYRLIYNADTSWAMQNSLDTADYLHGMVGFLEGSGVDALFWHDGSGGNNAYYDSAVMELNGERIGRVEPLLRRMLDAGEDPPAITIAAAREHGVDVFYSFRINDCHDSLGDGEAHPQLLATFKVEHPEWLIGPGHAYGGCNQLNFAVPEVLDFKFAILEEAARKYDFDGFEIDFQRNAPYFIPGTEPEQAHILTGFLRRVREHFRERAVARGRDIALAVRVCESMEACRLDGFDVPAWIDEGLIDMIVLGSGAVDIEVEAFAALARPAGIGVYPCLYGWPSGYGPFTTAMCRALATNYWHQGADGIYTFNWNAHTHVQRRSEPNHQRFAHQVELLREIDDPEKLWEYDKEFVACRNSGSPWYPHNWLHSAMPATLTAGASVEVPVLMGEDPACSGTPRLQRLRAEFPGLREADRLAFELNGQALESQERSGDTITCPLSPDSAFTGRNAVRVACVEGSAVADKLWIDVLYQ